MKYRTKTSKYLSAVMVAATLGLAAASSVAEDNRGKRMFERADANGDGYISFDEFNLPMRRAQRADLDGNGEITRAEVNEHATSKGDDILDRANERFSKMDLNGDDVVTQDEAREAAFLRLDQDQDGHLSPEEMKRPHKRHDKRQG